MLGTSSSNNNQRKRQRVIENNLSTLANIDDSTQTDGTLTEITQKPSPTLPKPINIIITSPSPSPSPSPSRFNDPTTADVILLLRLEPLPPDLDLDLDPDSISSADSADKSTDTKLFLHSDILCRSQYFSALLSDRWQNNNNNNNHPSSSTLFNHVLKIPSSIGTTDIHLTVIQLLYTDDYMATIDSAATALSILPIALELLFEDCVRACVKFLESVPWNEEEENRVLSIIPLLREEECKELAARVLPSDNDLSEEMLYNLVLSAINNQQNIASAKLFLSKLLREFSDKDSVRRVLERAFGMSLGVMKESMEAYSSPDFRRENYELEAGQRVNLHKAMTSGRQLVWLIERMIELKVAGSAVKEWSDQGVFTWNLQKAFWDDASKNIVSGLVGVVLRCTAKLTTAVSTGAILTSRQGLQTFEVDGRFFFPIATAALVRMSILFSLQIIHCQIHFTRRNNQSKECVNFYWYSGTWSKVAANGRSGGIISMWDEEVFEVGYVNEVNEHVFVFISPHMRGKDEWLLMTNVWPNHKETFWKELEEVREWFGGLWCIGGDFNAIRFMWESRKGYKRQGGWAYCLCTTMV
ncbi:hypothetical protein IFM89_011109 [Coptis chinensis]|uniref:BTB/POZ domain-containing protein n=1 Tax=Coptis chinensis TaxID=261450 RepID=A0A835IN63_9MAGN|nr:hypothetical protein IFM89_011109 [Coptis chinensis]